jgi:hypothetical protein|nr:MAG TPA: hypothetical protein [Caudoviricetes sp.]
MSKKFNNLEPKERLRIMTDQAKAVLERKIATRAKLYEKYIKRNFK